MIIKTVPSSPPKKAVLQQSQTAASSTAAPTVIPPCQKKKTVLKPTAEIPGTSEIVPDDRKFEWLEDGGRHETLDFGNDGLPPLYYLEPQHVKGFFDIDSYFVCGRSMLLMAPNVVTRVYVYLTHHQQVQNIKATRSLNKHLHNKTLDASSGFWVEVKFAESDGQGIFLLLAVKRSNGHINCGKLVAQRIVGKITESMNVQTETSMWHPKQKDPKLASFVKVFANDYEDCAIQFDKHCKEILDSTPNIADILVYKCRQGIR